MTGRDVPTRQKTLSVAFSVIMVLSMVAMGVAGFAGSAAAFEPVPSNSSTADIVADSASSSAPDTGANAPTHTVSYRVNPSNFTGGSSHIRFINISYGSSTDVDPVVGDENISVFTNGTLLTDTNVDNATSNNPDFINISKLNATGTDATTDISTNPLLITVEIKNASNPSSNLTTDITVGATDESVDVTDTETKQADLVVDQGPIDVEGTPFSTLHNALANASSGDTVKINQDVTVSPLSEFSASTPSGVTVEGSGGTLSVGDLAFATGGSISQAINVDNNNVTVDGLTIEGNSQSLSAITAATTNSTITSNTFNNFTSTTVNVDAQDGSGPDTIDLSSNTYTGDQGGALTIDINNFNDAADSLTIDSTDITETNGDTAIDVDAERGNGQIDIVSGSIEGDGSGTTGISTNNDTNITIDSVSINDTDVGVSAADIGDTTVITGASITNTGSQAIQFDDPTSNLGVRANVTVNGSTTIDQAGVGVEITHDSSNVFDLNIDNVVINGTDSGGVNITEMDGGDGNNLFNITGSTFTNNNAGIGVEEITNDVDDDIFVHFNTFDSNTVGIEVNDPVSSSSALNGTINLQFNDITNSDSAGLNVVSVGENGVNANYSWWDNRDSSRIVGPYTPQNAGSQLPIPRRVYSYTRLHTGGQP